MADASPRTAGTTTPGSGGEVIELEDVAHPERTRVVLDRDLSPFERLTPDQQRNLLVRVLCELVAYQSPELAHHRLAG